MAEQVAAHDAESLKELGLKGMTSLPELSAKMGKHETISPTNRRFSKHFQKVTPKDLEHLTLLAGVPSTVAKRSGYKPELKRVQSKDLPSKKFNFDKLPPAAQQAVMDAGHNLLFGLSDESSLRSGPNKLVVDHMLVSAKDLPVFTAKELIVKDGETREFKNVSTIIVDHIVVYGTGQIVLNGQVKVISKKIEYLPNQKS